jgi:uncharacterized protein YjbJ (UPF0337 family)
MKTAFPWIIAGAGLGLALVYFAFNEPETQSETGWDSVENAADRTWRWGSKSRVSGAGTNAVGRLKEVVGRGLGDDDLTDEGMVDQAVGTAKDVAGKVAHAAGETLHEMNF